MPQPKVIFLCTGNSARSQMAEALLRHHAGDQFEVYSAGLEPKGVHPLTVRVMDELNIDTRDHTSKSTSEFMGRMHFRYLITVCGNAEENCPRALWAQAGEKLHWPFNDPAAATGTDEQKLAKFREVRDQIDTQIQTWLHEINA